MIKQMINSLRKYSDLMKANPHIGKSVGRQKVIDSWREQRLSLLVWTNRMATVAEVTKILMLFTAFLMLHSLWISALSSLPHAPAALDAPGPVMPPHHSCMLEGENNQEALTHPTWPYKQFHYY